jgi:endonuclease G
VSLYGKVYIFAGPVFLGERGSDEPLVIPFIGKGRVAVPIHFFRIHVVKIKEQWRALSFLVPNQPALEEDITRYLVSVNQVEAVTSLDFFASLPEPQRSVLKSETPTELWR